MGEDAATPPDMKLARRQLHTRVNSLYEVPLAGLARSELRRHVERLTLTPRDPFQRGDSSFPVYELTDTHLRMPRWYGIEKFGFAKEDLTQEGTPMTPEARHFNGTLKPVQVEATNAMWSAWQKPGSPRGGVLVLGCGQGKTVCALSLAARLGVATIVLCHKVFLLDQWRERAQTFLPNATTGVIQQNRVDVGVDICFASLQSVAQRDYDPEVFANYGLVIVDEAHHIAAPVLGRGLAKLNTRFVCALSATPERRDGLTLHDSLGPILFRASRPHERVLVTRLLYVDRQKQRELINRLTNKPQFAQMLNRIADDATRTNLVAQHLMQHLRNGRQIIVLSDRIAQLEALKNAVVERGHAEEEVALYIGRSTPTEREDAAKRQLLLSSYGMAREGLDLIRLDTICLLSPSSSIEQAVGRILRPNKDKKIPLVLDVIENFSLFSGMAMRRLNHYKKCLYEVQDVPLDINVADKSLFK